MPQPKLLEGDYMPIQEERETLREQVQDLKNQLDDARRDFNTLNRERMNDVRAISSLRAQLTPLYRALQQVFGEMESVPEAGDGPPANNGDPRIDTVWRAWKEKLPGAPAKIIDALRTHGELSTQQLAIACRIGKTTVTDSVYKLNRAGLINKAGGRFSLKQL